MKKGFVQVGIIVAVCIVLLRGGGVALSGLVRFALPVAIVYFGYRAIKGALVGGGEKSREFPRAGNGDKGETIMICAQCGRERLPGHQCKGT